MAISRMQMNRQLYAGGGIMDVTPRENFGWGSKFKKFVRKVIPNEIADVAVKAAPFVAPFNPLIAAGMAGLGGFDQTGSISKSLRSGALTYGLGNLARVVGGAGFQGGLKAPGTGTGFGSYFTSPMSGQQLFGAQQEAAKLGTAGDLDSIAGPSGGIEEYVYKTDPSKLTLGQQADIIAEQVSQTPNKTGYSDIFGRIVGKDATLGQRTQAIKELGGKALKDIYTTDKGKLDKNALFSTIAGVGSYIEAKKLAEEAELVDDADEYTEEMYEADKAKYMEKYEELLNPDQFYATGGRVNFLKGGDTSYNAMITEMYIKAGGEEGTGMDIDSFADMYFPKMQEGGRVKLETGGIPSIMLAKKEYNFMDLIDKEGEDEYYEKKAEELDRKYNPERYKQILPKEKPMDKYMLDAVMSEKGMRTLSEETRDDAMKMYAERAYKKGQISEDEYREIMGFKIGGRVGYKDAGFTTIEDLGIEREEIEPKFEYNLEDFNLLQEMPKVMVMDKEGKTRIVPENVAERLGLNVIMDSFDTEQILRSENKAKGGRVGYKDGPSKSDIFGLGGEEGVEKIGKDIEEGLGSMANIITDKDGNVYLPLQYLRKFGEDIFFGGQKNPKLPESFYNKLSDKYIEEMKKVKERGYKKGGRVSYKIGSKPKEDEEGIMSVKMEMEDEDKENMMMADAPGITFTTSEKSYLFKTLAGQGGSDRSFTIPQLYGILNNPNSDTNIEDAKALKAFLKIKGFKTGGRVQYAMGSEVPVRENQAGVSEMDFRQTGGFVPPIGVKEKADDIPAMLSNNEFVFTADAVRAAGGGSVNKGAQKMYALMKQLEGKVI
jgi:hypothetical protein